MRLRVGPKKMTRRRKADGESAAPLEIRAPGWKIANYKHNGIGFAAG